MTSPFQYNPDKLGDSYFEQGSLDHIVLGNEGRTLDYRRTPVRVKEIRELSGLVILEILDFEDKGNTWEIPFEEVAAFQFALGSPRADRNTVSRYAAIAERLDKRMEIACDDESRRTTLAHLAEAEQEARRWFRLHSTTLGTGVRSDFSYKEGLSPFYDVIEAYMQHHNLSARLSDSMPSVWTTGTEASVANLRVVEISEIAFPASPPSCVRTI